MELQPVFTNVNGDNQPYDVPHDNLADALRVLRRFPNDRIVVTLEPANPWPCPQTGEDWSMGDDWDTVIGHSYPGPLNGNEV